MASIQLCMLNSQYIHAAPAPWCLKKGIEVYARSSHTVHITEGTVNEAPEVLLRRITAAPAQIYGFSCYIWNITMVEQLAAQLRAVVPNAYIVYGGPEATHRAEELLQHGVADAVICGEGEVPLAQLLDAYEQRQLPVPITGVWYRNGTQITQNGIYVSKELPPAPDDDTEYISRLNGRIAYIETSRGCPFSCAFCLSGRAENVRFRSEKESLRRLIALANSGAQTIKLVDRTFNCNPSRTYRMLCALMEGYGKAYPKSVCFHFEVAADLFDEQTLELLAHAPIGLFQLEAGIQSFHADTLAAISRKTDTDRLYAVLHRLIVQNNIHVHVDLIAGLPFEDEARFAESFDRAYSLQPHMLQFGFLKLLHGSRLRAEAPLYAFDAAPQPPYEVRATKWLTPQALQRMHRAEDALDRVYNSGRFRRTAAYLLRVTGMSPFALYQLLGERTANHASGIALRDYAALLLQVGKTLPNVSYDSLRDTMVCDWLATVRGGKLPPCLRVTDAHFAKGTAAAREKLNIPPHAFAAALLYADGVKIAVADYRAFDPVNKQYTVTVYDLHAFI